MTDLAVDTVHLGMDYDVALENYLSEKPRFRETMKQFTLGKIKEVVHPRQQDVGLDLKRICRYAREEDWESMEPKKKRERTPLSFFVTYQRAVGSKKLWRVKPNPAYWSSKSKKKMKRDELSLPLYKRGSLGDSNSKSSRALQRGQEALEVWDREMGIEDDWEDLAKEIEKEKGQNRSASGSSGILPPHDQSTTPIRDPSPTPSSLTSLEDLPSTSPADSPDSSVHQVRSPFDRASSSHNASLERTASLPQEASPSSDSPPARNESPDRHPSPTPSSLTSLEDLPSPSGSSSRPIDSSGSDALPLDRHASPPRIHSPKSPLPTSNPSTESAAPPKAPAFAKVSVVGCDLGTTQYVAGVVIREDHVQFWKQGSTDQNKRSIVDTKLGQADGKLSEESHLAQILTGADSHLSLSQSSELKLIKTIEYQVKLFHLVAYQSSSPGATISIPLLLHRVSLLPPFVVKRALLPLLNLPTNTLQILTLNLRLIDCSRRLLNLLHRLLLFLLLLYPLLPSTIRTEQSS